MEFNELLRRMKRLKRSIKQDACDGCGVEHNCTTEGCRILREAETLLGAIRDVICGEAAPATEEFCLAHAKAGDTFCIGEHELVVLEQLEGTTAVISRNLLPERMAFGDNNRYDGSNADKACIAFAEEIAAAVGAENLMEHAVDLTSDDGLKDYGTVLRKASLLTADRYRRYVDILDAHKIGEWWWLATPSSTKRHANDRWVLCVAPSGYIYYGSYNYDDIGVRPFCILKSDIFVSK